MKTETIKPNDIVVRIDANYNSYIVINNMYVVKDIINEFLCELHNFSNITLENRNFKKVTLKW